MESDSRGEPVTTRAGTDRDLPAVAEIQALAEGAARWPVGDYLGHDFRVAVHGDQVVGFLVAREVAPAESEILNIAVHPDFRRRGAGRALVHDLLTTRKGAIFLEVRESNSGARKFYQSLHFHEVGTRPAYYATPPEGAIVMNLHS